MTKHWEEIVEVAARKKRPFSFKVTARSSRLEAMD